MQYSHGQVRTLFDRIAHRYDLLNKVLSAGFDRRWRRRMIDSCRTLRHPRILDLATGTGDVLHAADELDPSASVGVDLSREMLIRARNKLSGVRCTFIEGAAETLPFRPGSFDLVLVAFGVRNFSDRSAGLTEMRRVLRHGGEARILEFSQPSGLFRTVYLPYFRRLLPGVGGLISGSREAYEYLPDTVMDFPSVRDFSHELELAGFSDVRSIPLTRGILTLYSARVADNVTPNPE